MRLLKAFLVFAISYGFLLSFPVDAQPRKVWQLPDIEGYETLVCDFHMHTVFSDGLVWPTVRVDEAWREGLDVISLTEHIEYLPHKDYLTKGHNQAYEVAKSRADELGLVLIRGAEITRGMPPGHLNALFLEDANALEQESFDDAIRAANEQGAFVFWNHPGWEAQAPDSTRWYEKHTEIYEKGYLHGIEVANYNEWYPKAVGWSLNKELTIVGNSDMHQPSGVYLRQSGHKQRVVTLVFAAEKSAEAIKQALKERRTVAWIGERLIGETSFLDALFKKAVELKKQGNGHVLVNSSDFSFQVSPRKADKPVTIPPQQSVRVNWKPENGALSLTVKNLTDGENSHLQTQLDVSS